MCIRDRFLQFPLSPLPLYKDTITALLQSLGTISSKNALLHNFQIQSITITVLDHFTSNFIYTCRFTILQLSHSTHYLLPVSYTHLRAHETPEHLVCRLLL